MPYVSEETETMIWNHELSYFGVNGIGFRLVTSFLNKWEIIYYILDPQ